MTTRRPPRDIAPVSEADRAAALAAFDPWQPWMATAQRAAELGSRQVHQHRNAQEVLDARGRIETDGGPGDRRAMLFAMVQCVEAQLLPPDWLAKSFLNAFDQVLSAEVLSLDDAFGRPYPKNTTRAALRKRRSLAVCVFDGVETERAKKRTKGVGEAIFGKVGRKHHISASRCRDIYNEFKKEQEWRRSFLPISEEDLKKISNKR